MPSSGAEVNSGPGWALLGLVFGIFLGVLVGAVAKSSRPAPSYRYDMVGKFVLDRQSGHIWMPGMETGEVTVIPNPLEPEGLDVYPDRVSGVWIISGINVKRVGVSR